MSMGALDVNAGLLVLSHRYDASSTANGYAPSASFDHSGIFGAPGLDLRVRLDINSEVAPDVRARIYTERMGAGESVPWNLEWAALVGASYGQELTHWFSWKGTGHLHRQTVGAFTYSNEARTELEMTPLSNWGLRLGAGAKFTVLEDGFLELEAAETFGLRPVDHYFGLTGGWKIDDRFTGTLGFDLDVRHLRATLDTGSLEIEDRVQGVRVGVQTTL